MPELLAITDITEKDGHEILRLYTEAGWWPEETSLEALEKLIRGSYLFLVVLEDVEIIGMGRVISDGVSDAYIQDVTVRKDFRGKGLGALIIKDLCKRLFSDGINWVGLIAEKGSHPFYENLDFVQMPGSIPMLHKKTYQIMGFDKPSGENK
ncbi:GNAT family N-acetyltransferase [Desulfococcaceae bacterium OttesenSCG-928-F15]|nr:GNAT family N-acetyltransferase [Desulfococcaceae bacterium OttesenSCG-928-F15]